MPELPETETIARDLNRLVSGQVIAAVGVRRSDVLRGGTARALRHRLLGKRIAHVWRRAKAVVLDLDSGDRLVVVPRFTGALIVAPAEQPADAYATVILGLEDGRSLTYRDVRRLGTVTLLDPSAFSRFDQRLGVEPLDDSMSLHRISDSLRSSRQSIKKVLMDQRRIAGIGNIYANEALWSAGVDPSREARRLRLADVGKVLDAVVTVLRSAVEARGTTFRDFRDASGEPGGFARQLAVYGRQGRPCPRCGTRLALTHAIDGRATVFCFRCQH